MTSFWRWPPTYSPPENCVKLQTLNHDPCTHKSCSQNSVEEHILMSRHINSDAFKRLSYLIWEMFCRDRPSLQLFWQHLDRKKKKKLMIAGLHSVPSAASWHSSVNTHTQYRLPHTHVLILKENSPYMCTLKQQKPSHWNGIWKTPHLSHTLRPPLSLTPSLHRLSFSCFTQDVRMSLSNFSIQKCPLSSLHFFSCLCLPAAVGWELTANKRAACF